MGLFLLFLVAGIYTLNRMRLSRNRVLCAFNEELQSRVDQQTLQLREEVRERKKAEQEQIRLSAHLIEAREKERRKVARDIHDELGQSLTAVNMDLARISGEVGDLQRRDLGETRKLVKQVIQQIRTLITDLRPTVLETLGLSGGLLWLGESFEERFPFTVSADLEDCSFCCGESETVALFRIAQEALNNVARHADADTVSLRLFREGDSMCLEIEDDGKGFDPNVREVLSSFGIMGMRERARALGSELRIRSRPGEGSCLSVTVNRVEK
ncbi:MAG: sensor histidine kinase [Candidatus Krumholzibacteria bacterium]|nr:sensor histidine kinase [Candidatus Krumholzibacteria bacterium]MDP6668927.1 sensor histidine kinase [Candidatus Krumholzibacteria bacterium]MDP7022249.1 sensor histidine kinase [Candidatus Krumholzibacteria bacterium]